MNCHNISMTSTLALAIAVIHGLCPFPADAEDTSPSQRSPETVTALKKMEAEVIHAVAKATPAVVAIGSPRPGAFENFKGTHFSSAASGVITHDGLILSQWHVSHQADKNHFRIAGDQTDIVLQDGRRLKAELLGANPIRDLSLLRIVDPGDYPYIELAKPKGVVRGERVLKLGHPFGYRASRGATARLGRVLYTGKAIEIVADCLTFAGDSGGPLIDLDGNLVGICENPAAPQIAIWSLPERAGTLTCYSSVETIARLMPDLRNPVHESRPDRGVNVEDFHEDKVVSSQRRAEIYGDTDSKVLPVDEWSQGETTRAAWTNITQKYAGRVVEILNERRKVSFGTVVDSDGWILTKATEIPDEPRCRVLNGDVVPARMVGVDPAYDLALLKVKAVGLLAVEWNAEPVRPAGKSVAAADGRGDSLGVGIVCVAQRTLEGPFPTEIRKAAPYTPLPTPPELLGKIIEGKGLVVRRVKGRAAIAGIVPGDNVIRVGEVLLTDHNPAFRDHNDLSKCVETLSPGDMLSMVLDRNGERVDIMMKLAEEPYVRCPGAGARFRNLRADDFPEVFEHDIPLALDECGGPLVDLDGQAVGITIARVGAHGCMAIPANVITAVVNELRRAAAETPP